MAPTTSTDLHKIWKQDGPFGERFNVDRGPESTPLSASPQALHAARVGSRDELAHAVLDRMKGPGGYYNIGNALALITGLAVQIAAVIDDEGHARGAVLEAVNQYFFGSPGATALTLAIIIFFVSGEMYHRAWSRGCPPKARMNWWGDFLSGVGAVVLTFALAAFGDVLLALVSGLLLAAGKFGSALVPENYATPEGNLWPNRFRSAVLVSRLPALAALAIQFVDLIGSDAASTGRLAMTGVMLACYLIWARADLLLFAASRAKIGRVVPDGAQTAK